MLSGTPQRHFRSATGAHPVHGRTVDGAPAQPEQQLLLRRRGWAVLEEEEKGNERVSTNRYRELKQTGAKTVATGCPFCMRMITEETAKEEEGAAPQVLDIAEIVAKNLTK